ncbi:MAG: preprotein translocase subunit SecE [Deltaproteobacteria bacterium]|nr:preprotein translocase subunit SecE [Deltaproteobacteria bacterium]
MVSKKKGQSGKGKADVAVVQKKFLFSPSSVREFVREVEAEFKKIVWPTRKVTFGLTGFVIVLVIIIAIYLGSVDLLLGKLVSWVLKS